MKKYISTFINSALSSSSRRGKAGGFEQDSSGISKRKLLVIGAAIMAAIIAAGSGYWLLKGASASEVYETASVTRRTLVTSVSATGSIKPAVGAEVKVGSRISGRVEKLHVAVGDIVKKGQVIVELDSRELNGNIEKAQADVSLAAARLESYLAGARKEEVAIAGAGLQQTVRNAEVAEANYKRLAQLYEMGAISLSQKELAEKEMVAAQSQQEISKRQFEIAQSKYLPTDIQIAQAQLAQAQAVLSNSQTQLTYALISSPINGTVASVTTQEGETVAANNQAPTFVTIVDLSRLQVEVYIDETDVGKIKVGQKVQVVADAFPTKDFEGEITAISPRATIVNNVVYYIATVKIVNTEGLLKPDMTVNVTILLDQRANVLVVPSKAIKKEDGRQFVYVMNGGKAVERAVKAGKKDQKYTEILEGLREGETVITGEVTGKVEQASQGLKLPNLK